jgi:hypothetical protein
MALVKREVDVRIPFFITLQMLLVVATAGAQAPPVRTPTAIAEAFLNRVAKGDIAPAYDELLRGAPIPAPQVDLLKRQTGALLPVYGKTLGFDSIGRTSMANTWFASCTSSGWRSIR